ncbi:hypothetical protein AXG93_1928s1020 [Marchantia polymorpha subsp. ruderalis]|uniref:Uncharacterized protein n=1 Tax=Marchantia polymorpha subsp. ruderalis TaxID=1480154 RepID=A0A176WDF7_MARPO|nr:hypothetical protein AXG93_1928s1020 [Marchantia polymorpha subsp. ruderalis]
MARERAATLSTKCAEAKAALKEREAQLREKEIECEVLQWNLEKESGRCAELEETCGGLCKSNENGQKMTADLLTRLEKCREAYDEAVKCSERLITIAEKREKKHVKELAKVEARRAEEVRSPKNFGGRLQRQRRRKKIFVARLRRLRLGKADMRSQKSRRRMEKAEEAYRHLQDETIDEAKLRVEKCLQGFAMWELQTMKWLKLDSLEQRLMSIKASRFVGQKQIVEIVKTFSEGLNEARENVEVEIANVLRRLGAESSLDDAVTVTSDGTASETNSPQAVEIPELPL